MKKFVKILIAVYMVASLGLIIYFGVISANLDWRVYDAQNELDKLKATLAEIDSKTTPAFNEFVGTSDSDILDTIESYVRDIYSETKDLDSRLSSLESLLEDTNALASDVYHRLY